MKHQTIYFPHIPKCGGTTLRKALEKSDKLIFYDYEHPPSYKKWQNEQCERRNSEFKLLDFCKFDLVFGHYPLCRYNHDNNVVLLIRDPVDRLISNFNYFKYLFPADNKLGLARQPVIEEIKNGLNLLGFAEKSSAHDFYFRYTKYVDTARFALVGFMPEINPFYEKLECLLGLPKETLSSVSKERANNRKDLVSEDEMSILYKLLEDEIVYYESQRKIWLDRY